MTASFHPIVLTTVVVLISVCIISLFVRSSRREKQIKHRIFMLDALLEKRAVVVPELIEILRKHVVFDEETLRNISNLSQTLNLTSNTNSYLQTEEGSFTVKQILDQMRDWPELKSDKNFIQLKNDFLSYEEEIEASRQFLKKASLPDNLLYQYKH